MNVRVGMTTDVGRVRDHNEDAAFADPPLFLVADGMGGHAAGEVASRIAVDTMAELTTAGPLGPDDVVRQLAACNDRILASVGEHPEQAGMGTTATGVAIVRTGGTDHWAVFNIGDSRVYRLIDGRLSPVTVDHSEVQELVDVGAITPEEALRHPLRNVVTRSLGVQGAPKADVWVVPPYAGERFLICSDGLSNEVTDEGIASILLAHEDPQEAADALVAAALEAGGRDNVTVVVVALDRDADEDLDADTAPRPTTGARR